MCLTHPHAFMPIYTPLMQQWAQLGVKCPAQGHIAMCHPGLKPASSQLLIKRTVPPKPRDTSPHLTLHSRCYNVTFAICLTSISWILSFQIIQGVMFFCKFLFFIASPKLFQTNTVGVTSSSSKLHNFNIKATYSEKCRILSQDSLISVNTYIC